MTIRHAYRQLLAALYELYDDREAANISDWVIEHVTGQKKIDRIVYKDLPVNSTQQEQLEIITSALQRHTPVQYVLGEAWFDGMKFFVNEHVLIPRPETEELVEWVSSDVKQNERYSLLNAQCAILDVGTGSGCIAVALKKRLPQADLHAIDISPEALVVAGKNADKQGVNIKFTRFDILEQKEWGKLPVFDILVSNPPYIKLSDKSLMNKNVVKFEPHTALFVDDEDALIFYRALAHFGTMHLKENGFIYAEINEALGEQAVELFKDRGYKNIELKKDMQGKDRMIKVVK